MQRLPILLLIAALWVSATASHLAAQQPEPPQNLPDDREQYSIVLVVADDDIWTETRMNELFRDPQLNQLARGCAIHEFRVSNPVYRARYAAALPPTDMPAFALCRPDGGVVYKACGEQFPTVAKDLYANLTYYANLDRSLRTGDGHQWDDRTQDCPDGTCPNLNPSPSRPWIRPLQPDGALRPDTWIPDSIDVRPQVNVDLGGDLVIWIAIGLLSVVVIGCGGCALVMLLRD